jgi:hypothetical protein
VKQKRLILLGFTAFLLFALIRTFAAFVTAARVLPMTPPRSIGMGGELLKTADRLEKEIGGRAAYEVDVRNDPLKLTRIIDTRGKRGLARAEVTESMKELRLSCTIISSTKATAIIKHQGRSFVVGVGDEIAGRQVMAIDKKKVVLRYNGQDIELFNRPAPLAEIRYETREKLDQLEL